MRHAIGCEPAEAMALRELLHVQQSAARELTIAFTMFARGHGLPDGAQLAGLTDAGAVLVDLPDPPPPAAREHG